MRLPALPYVKAEPARRSTLDYVDHVWMKGATDKFEKGFHTREIAAFLDEALSRFRQGKSTLAMIKVPFRHGKSDLVSRYFPSRFFGEFPDCEGIFATYGSSLSYDFSRFGRRVVSSERYGMVYPGVSLSKGNNSVQQWGIQDRLGMASWMGLGGAMTGKGAHLAIVDDFFKSRQEAESETIRSSRWADFTDGLLTRLAPVHIVIVMGTPWHTDDLFGRISKRMREDPDFPYFRELKFPAESPDYPTGYLFPERYPPRWYRAMRHFLGKYSASGLLDCEPRPREGRMFNTSRIVKMPLAEWPRDLHYARGWDLASSAKERTKDDPDYTVGALVGVSMRATAHASIKMPVVYLLDLVRGQWEATERNRRILDTTVDDGTAVRVGIESFGAYKDAYTQIRDALKGVRGVTRVNLPGDKVAKYSVLEPIVENCNFVVPAGAAWVDALIEEMDGAPAGAHDDILDAITVAYSMCSQRTGAARDGRVA